MKTNHVIGLTFAISAMSLLMAGSTYAEHDEPLTYSEYVSADIDELVTIEAYVQGKQSLYPDSSLADLYDPLTMPPELRKAHTANDIAVMRAYGFKTSMSESDCVGELMKMYQELVSKQ